MAGRGAAAYSTTLRETQAVVSPCAISNQSPCARRSGPLPLSVTVRVARANLRKGPGNAEPVVAKVPRGSVLSVKRGQGDWLEVTHGTVTGWVSRTVVD